MTLRDRIPVEPLDGARLDRIEQRIVVEAAPLLARTRPAAWPWWALAGTAALAAATVVLVRGVGRGDGHGGAPTPVVVATDARGTRVDLGDALVDVGPDTSFRVVRAGGGIDLELTTGDVTLEVPPRRGRPPLWVRAGEVGVRVVGTGFSVRRHATVEVEVTHGAVEVHRAAAIVRVATGERWSSTDGAVAALAAASPRAPAGASDGAPAAAATSDEALARSTIAADALALGPDGEPPGLRARAQAAPPPRVDALPRPRAPASPATAVVATARSPRVRGPEAERPAPQVAPPDLRGDILAQPVAPPPLLPPGPIPTDADERARAYREIGFSRRDDADAALWGLARTQALELGQEREALRSLDYYVRRFSGGGQLEAVLWLRLRLLCARSLDAPCRAAAHTYIARFPNSNKADVAVRVTESR
jgi:hypothetical protein